MSRIGKQEIIIPDGVQVTYLEEKVTIKGEKGSLELEVPKNILLKIDDGKSISLSVKSKEESMIWGTYRALINNMVTGVTKGFEKRLEINGVGYRASLKGKDLELLVGFSHPVLIKAKDGVEFKVEKNIVVVSGIDKQMVGQLAAKIREVKKPEPYKGKGIRYIDEVVRRKVGKKAVASEGV